MYAIRSDYARLAADVLAYVIHKGKKFTFFVVCKLFTTGDFIQNINTHVHCSKLCRKLASPCSEELRRRRLLLPVNPG